jgi:WD40 repeat protein
VVPIDVFPVLKEDDQQNRRLTGVADRMLHAFLSYARGDDEPFVKRLYEDLTSRNFRIWWDRADMPNRGLTFLQEIRDHIDESERLIAVIGPMAIRSEYVRAEWNHARIFSKGVVAIPRLSSYGQIPFELARFHGPDFREDSRYHAALDELDRILRQPVEALGPLASTVPALPAYFLPREDKLTELHNMVLADIDRPVNIAASNRTTSLVGMPGTGKSVLAAAFARSFETRRSFSKDGVVWSVVGQNPAPGLASQNIARAFGIDLGPDPSLVVAGLSSVLRGRRCLIVLDDVWEIKDAAEVVNALDERCRLLITTRHLNVASAFGRNVLTIVELGADAAISLLAAYAHLEPSSLLLGGSLHAVASEVARLSGNLPFALALSGAMIGEGNTWSDLIAALKNADLSFIESELPNYPYKNVLIAQDVSVARLDPSLRERYRDLVVFPADRGVPEPAVLTMWSESGSADYENRKALVALRNRSLIQLEGAAPARTLSMHDLQHDYLRATVKDVRARHSSLVTAYGKLARGKWAAGPNDGYFFQALPSHLVEAGREHECQQLLMDFNWLQAKLEAVGIAEVLADYRRVLETSGNRLLEEAMRRSAMILVEDRGQLASQILGRLAPSADLEPVLDGARRWGGRPWLRPLAATLLHPGAAICFSLEGHEGSPRSVAISPDGHWAASAGNSSPDGTIRIWDAERGMPLHTLVHQAEPGGYTPLAISPGGEWVLCGSGRAINVWDRGSGRLAFSMSAHQGEVTALAVASNFRRAISASNDGAVFIWDLDVRSGKQLAASLDVVRTVSISSDGLCVTALHASGLTHWEVESKRVWSVEVYRSNRGGSAPWQHQWLSTSTNGDRVFFGTQQWEPRTGRVTDLFPADAPGNVLAISADGNIALVLSTERSIEIWEPLRNVRRAVLPDQGAWVYCASLTPDGARAVVGLNDHRVRIWDIGLARPDIEPRRDRLVFCTVTTDGTYGIACFETGEKQVWDLATGAMANGTVSESVLAQFEAEQQERASAAAVDAMTPEHMRILMEQRGVTVLADRQRTKTGEYEEPDEGHGYRLAVYLAGAADPIIFPGHELPVTAASLSGDGKLVVSGSIGRKLRVWDLASGRQAKVLKGHKGTVYAIATSSNSSLCVSASEDRTVRIWDLAGDAVEPLASFTGEVRMRGCGITPDGKTVIAGEEDGRVHILRLECNGC